MMCTTSHDHGHDYLMTIAPSSSSDDRGINIATATCRLSFHGAAANSSPHSLLWVRAPKTPNTDSSTDTTTATKQSSSPPLPNGTNDLIDTLIYASSGVVNLASSHSFQSNTITTVESTLVTRTLEAGTTPIDSTAAAGVNGSSSGAAKKVLARGEAVEDAAAPRSITALAWVANNSDNVRGSDERQDQQQDRNYFGIVAAFSDGTVTSWRYAAQNSHLPSGSGGGGGGGCWEEHVVIGHDPQRATVLRGGGGSGGGNEQTYFHNNYDGRVCGDSSSVHESIADISAAMLDCRTEQGQDSTTLVVATASSRGVLLHVVSHIVASSISSSSMVGNNTKKERVYSRQVSHHAMASVHLQCQAAATKDCYLFAGSAAPRHNKVWVYTLPYSHSHDCSTKNNNDSNNAAKDFESNDKKNTATSSSVWVAIPFLTIGIPQYHGHLMGHQDWITCLAWLDFHYPQHDDDDDDMTDVECNEKRRERKVSLLATSGHDAKIRLWKFATSSSGGSSLAVKDASVAHKELQDDNDHNRQDNGINSDDDDNDNEDEANIDDLQEDEGEARLIITHANNRGKDESTAVSLEALLMGHEEAVTSLTWRPQRRELSGSDNPCLLSSSMDRTILLWMEEGYSEVGDDGEVSGGIWTPISRVGSAGGILGGSLGASLMGFVDAAFSPDASRIVGHGYGGSIHFWTQAVQSKKMAIEMNLGDKNDVDDEVDDGALLTARWVADPCITGHFRSVQDMAWDPNGEYLLTTSSDQTTRLWVEVPISSTTCRWLEVGRPQVHGYDMTSIVCIGGGHDNINEYGNGEPRHRFVSGADEKVLRVFDAPASALRLLRSIKQSRNAILGIGYSFEQESENNQSASSTWRVECAFMPSLGLSNKASADTDQESSKYSGPVNDDVFAQTLDTVEGDFTGLKLPSERDLGVTTLWPEARKLFGHETELVCLDAYRAPSGSKEVSLVASSCKARNDVSSAAIRLWDANKGTCVGILQVSYMHVFSLRGMIVRVVVLSQIVAIMYIFRVDIAQLSPRCLFHGTANIW